jgi:HlyD family secretion protein
VRTTRGGWLLASLGLLAAVVGIGAFVGRASTPARRPVTAHPTVRDIERRIDAAGTVRPVSVVHVGALVSGVVVSTTVEAGDRVRAGQRIATIDEAPYRLQLERARALARAAERRVAQARGGLRRQTDLQRAGFIAPAALDTSETTAREADEDLRVAAADVETARLNLAHCRIDSPISGIVLTKEIAAGQSVASSFQVPDLFTIVSRLDRLEVVAMFAESDLGAVVPGATVALHVPAFPDKRFSATVRRVLDTPENRQGIVMFPVLLALANDDGLLRPGMTAYAELRVAGVRRALTVPPQAVAFARARDRAAHLEAAAPRHVYVLRAGAVVPVAVRFGAADDAGTQVLPIDRLDPRDDVVLAESP